MLRVLVVEDDPAFREEYRLLLEELGYTCTLASSVQEAHAVWSPEAFDVVLLDQRLQGSVGPNDGIDLLEEARLSTAKVILITGYATDDAIKRAFELGAYDYLEKTAVLRSLLRAKLDHLREHVRARQRFTTENDRQISELWSTLREGSAAAKGRRLEELILRLMTSVPGFLEFTHNLRTESEELDVVIRNESQDPLWSKLPAYFLCEAKNWSKKVGTPEVAWMADKIRRRKPHSLGFFFAAQGFSEPVKARVDELRAEGVALVMVDHGDLQELVQASDRGAVLKRLHARWAVA